MADNKTNYLENALLNHVLRNTAYTPPATVYLALLTADPGEGGALTEITGGSYARQAIAFGAPSGGVVSNSGDIVFTNMPAASITHVAIMDASTGGNALYYVPLPSPVNVANGVELTFGTGTITVRES